MMCVIAEPDYRRTSVEGGDILETDHLAVISTFLMCLNTGVIIC